MDDYESEEFKGWADYIDPDNAYDIEREYDWELT